MIVQTHNHETIKALATPWKGIHQPLIMEAHSLQYALKWCQEQSLLIHQIESDCKTLVDAIICDYSKNLHLQEFITQINSFLSSFPQASVSYAPRKANDAAHHLAKHARLI
ncbi:hypothetical protein F8388_023515 [Cannabis sativa]|uniref:RNase H type-1 domain-containing protein n=1 Tax=Cannabis sativa TaxID=3483 RepID=A0A7J6GLR1_CANSA|nr:hypothetical protein F8388_023515 [Cannabis sativa]